VRRQLVWVAVLAVTAATAVAALAMRKPSAPAAGAPGGGAVTAATEFLASDLWTVEPLALTRSLPLTGTLRAVNQTTVKTRVAGDLVQVTVREGETVARGQLLARIDPTEYEWRVKREEASLAAAQAQLDMATRTRTNNAQLVAKGFISQNAFDSAQSGLEAAVGTRDAAAAALEIARKSLADTAIRAPMSGTVAERFAQPGEKLPVDGRVLSIVDLSAIELEAPIPADDIAQVATGQRAEFRPEGTSLLLAGKVARISPATATGSRSVLVYIGVDRPAAGLRAGMFAQGHLILAGGAPRLAVPASAVHEEAGAATVLALRDGRVEKVWIETGQRGDAESARGLLEVRGGLAAGTQVVRQFDARLVPGAPARVTSLPAAR